MRIRSNERLGNERLDNDHQQGPIILRQRFSHRTRWVRAAVLLLTGCLICVPLISIFAASGGHISFASFIAGQPITSIQLSLLALLGVSAICYGAYELFRPALRARTLRLDRLQVHVAESVSGRTRSWREPLNAYRGLRHQVNTTSEGAIHTLLIEHPSPERTLHIVFGTNLSKQTILDVSLRLGLPILDHSSAPAHFWPQGLRPGWLNTPNPANNAADDAVKI